MNQAGNNDWIKKIKKEVSDILLILYRLTLTLAAFIDVVYLGLKIPEILKGMDFSWTLIDVKMVYGGPILGGAMVLYVLKFLGKNAPVVWEYVAHENHSKILEFYSALLIAVLGFSIANLSIRDIVSPISKQKVGSSVFLHIQSPPVYLKANGKVGVPVFLLTFSEGTQSLNTPDPQLQLLENIVRTLMECSRIGDENSKHVRIKLMGFASSSGTDLENLDLANLRAEWVKETMENLFEDSAFSQERIEIIPHRWHTFADMKVSRIFMDENRIKHSGDRYSMQAAALNRRVEIHLLDVGGCQASEAL